MQPIRDEDNAIGHQETSAVVQVETARKRTARMASNLTQELNLMEEKSQGKDASAVRSDNAEDLAEVSEEALTVVDTVDVDLAAMDKFQKAMTPPANLKANAEPEMVETVRTVHRDEVDSDASEEHPVAVPVANAAHADQDHHAVVSLMVKQTMKILGMALHAVKTAAVQDATTTAGQDVHETANRVANLQRVKRIRMMVKPFKTQQLKAPHKFVILAEHQVRIYTPTHKSQFITERKVKSP